LILSVVVSLLLRAASVDISQSAFLALTSLVLYGAVCGLGWYLNLKRRGASLRDAGFEWVGWGPLLLMIPMCLGVLFVTGIVSLAASSLFGHVPTAQEQVLGTQPGMSGSDLVLILFATVGLAPVAEEFLLRGLLYRYVRGRRGILMGMVVSSLVWAVAHFIPILIATFFVFGMIEAFVAERYKSLYPAITLHALNNLVSVVGLYYYLNS
jgi:membrane protease YdiL (CAAX protease family)